MKRVFKGETHATSLCGRVHRALQDLGPTDVGTLAATLGADRKAVQKAMDSLKFRGIAYRMPSVYTLSAPPEEPQPVTVVRIKQRGVFDI